MSSFIKRKNDKSQAVLASLDVITEDAFISRFKEIYPQDWALINETWEAEECNTKPGKKHPMPHPDLYMKDMFRNAMSRKERLEIK